jgi:hypothetical protein
LFMPLFILIDGFLELVPTTGKVFWDVVDTELF